VAFFRLRHLSNPILQSNLEMINLINRYLPAAECQSERLSKIASVITSKAANGYQFKTGQRKTEAVRDKIVSTS
jgi:hypothetical protein